MPIAANYKVLKVTVTDLKAPDNQHCVVSIKSDQIDHKISSIPSVTDHRATAFGSGMYIAPVSNLGIETVRVL